MNTGSIERVILYSWVLLWIFATVRESIKRGQVEKHPSREGGKGKGEGQGGKGKGGD